MAFNFYTVYGAVAGGDTYQDVQIGLFNGNIHIGEQNFLLWNWEPPHDGRWREKGVTFANLFPDPIVGVNEFVRLTSRRFRFVNYQPAPVYIAGLVLFVTLDKLTRNVLATFPLVRDWQPGGIIAGRILVTSHIYDQ